MKARASRDFADVTKPIRRKKSSGKVISIRVSDEENDRLHALADGQPISTYMRMRSLDGRASRRGHNTSIKIDVAARLLGALGQARLRDNLERIADAAQNGALPLTEDVTEEIENACALIIAIRKDLIETLGIKPQD